MEAAKYKRLQKKIGDWEEVRSKGRWNYAWTRALISAILFTIMFQVVRLVDKERFSSFFSWANLFTFLLFFGFTAVSNYFIIWRLEEKQHAKQKKQAKNISS